MNRLREIWRAVLRAIPGTALHLAERKRRFERELLVAGVSRADALYLVSRRFPRRLEKR